MKERGRSLSAFFVSRCLDTPVKHEARVFDMASHSSTNNKQILPITLVKNVIDIEIIGVGILRGKQFISLHIWRDLLYSEMSKLLVLPASAAEKCGRL